MTTDNFTRKLIAILSADVKGYSRLMQDDEAATVRTLNAYREIITDLIVKHRGRIVDTPGDNVLVEFGSVVDAVQCAVEIQEDLKVRNAALPDNRKMEFRIGVNLGDIIAEGDRIYGDGINVAARLESLAEGGGICISGTVHHHIRNKLALEYEYLGDHTVKNISEPVPVFRIRTDKAAAPPIDGARRMTLRLRSRAIVAVLFVLAIVAWLTRSEWLGTDLKEENAEEGFRLLRMGKVAEAETTFNSLGEKGHSYHQGMAAVNMTRGDLKKAKRNYDLAVERQPDHPYCAVLKAHLLLCGGQLEEAERTYRRILEVRDLTDWQRAECYYGLGRIHIRKGDFQEAAAAFDQALALDPSLAKAYTAKGLALEGVGKTREAMEYYRKASEINSADHVSTLLYSRTKEQVVSDEAPGQRARIDELVAELSKAYREGLRPADKRDEWSSLPLYLFHIDLESKGPPAPVEGEDAFLSERLAIDITASPRLHRVERALLHKLLEELKLGHSELSDPQTAIRLGRILSARILVTGKIIRYKGQLEVSLRAIDTETTRVAATASRGGRMGESFEELISVLAQDFKKQIESAYPIRGRVTEVRGKEATLNVGSLTGVSSGMKMQVMESEAGGLELEVKDVQEKSCTAVWTSDTISLKEDWRVEEVRT